MKSTLNNSGQWSFMIAIRDRLKLERLIKSPGVDQPWSLTNGQKYDNLFISGYAFNQLVNEAYRQGYKISFGRSIAFDPREFTMCETPVILEINELPKQPKIGVLIKLAKDTDERNALIGFLVQAAGRLNAEIYNISEPCHKVFYQAENILIQTTYNHQEIDYHKSLLVTTPLDAEVLLFSINEGCTPEQEAEANRLVKEEWLPTILKLSKITQIETTVHVISPK